MEKQKIYIVKSFETYSDDGNNPYFDDSIYNLEMIEEFDSISDAEEYAGNNYDCYTEILHYHLFHFIHYGYTIFEFEKDKKGDLKEINRYHYYSKMWNE